MQSRRQRFHREPLWRVLWRRLTATAAGITLPVVVLAVVALGLPGTWLLLPPPHLPADTLVYDPQGQLLTYLYSTGNRIPVPGSHIPPVMQNALSPSRTTAFGWSRASTRWGSSGPPSPTWRLGASCRAGPR